MIVAPASATAVRFRRCTTDSGLSLGTRMSGRRSLSVTSAARSMSDRLVPCAIAAAVPMEHGQMTMPATGADPDAGRAPRSASSHTVTRDQFPPVAFWSSASDRMPTSCSKSRQPCRDTTRSRGICPSTSARSRRTPYGAPEAPVTARIQGRVSPRGRPREAAISPSGSAWGPWEGAGAARQAAGAWLCEESRPDVGAPAARGLQEGPGSSSPCQLSPRPCPS
jgi:hypothetical protein